MSKVKVLTLQKNVLIYNYKLVRQLNIAVVGQSGAGLVQPFPSYGRPPPLKGRRGREMIITKEKFCGDKSVSTFCVFFLISYIVKY